MRSRQKRTLWANRSGKGRELKSSSWSAILPDYLAFGSALDVGVSNATNRQTLGGAATILRGNSGITDNTEGVPSDCNEGQRSRYQLPNRT